MLSIAMAGQKAKIEPILVVDDSMTVAHVLRLTLEEAGYRDIELCGSLAEAMSQISSREFALVFIDKHLPDGDGLDLADRLRQDWPFTVKIMMTGDSSVETAIQAIEADIYAYLRKPLQKGEVLLKTERAIDRFELRKERKQTQLALEEANKNLKARQKELETTVERLIEAEKLASLGALSAGVAHEINNPACFILPNLDYLGRTIEKLKAIAIDADSNKQREIMDLSEHADRMLNRCQEGVERIRQVVQTLQIFSHSDHDEDRFDLESLSRSIVELMAHRLEKCATFHAEIAPSLWVKGNAPELAQALLNVLLHAERAVLSSQKNTHSISMALSTSEKFIRIIISDTGNDLPTARDSSLSPFLSSSQLEEGPELGMCLAHEVIARHRGSLSLERKNGKNIVEISLPRA